MKKITLLRFILLLTCCILIQRNVYSQWLEDSQYRFKLYVPENWSKNAYTEGTDKVHEFFSPDENVFIQLRAFEAEPGVTVDLLTSVYEENMLPQGASKEGLDDHTTRNGIPGKLGVYTSQYNGMDIMISAFFTIQEEFGYALVVIVPVHLMDEKGEEITSVTHSFMIEGIGSSAGTPGNENKPSGLRGFAGASSVSSGSSGVSSNIEGKYTFTSRSDGKSLVNYHYIIINSNGKYRERYQPKDSPGYEGGQDGTWRVNGNILTLEHQGGGITDTYTIRGNELIRRTDNGLTFVFRK